jgi:glucose-1-phosphate thymidylyltransferase
LKTGYNLETMNQLNVVILGGGFGARLNANVPKGLIQYQDTTLYGRVVKDLQHADCFNLISLITNAKFFDQYQNYHQQNLDDLKINLISDGVSNNDQRKGALGDLIVALDQTQGWHTDTLVLPTDTYYSFVLRDFIDFYFQQQTFVTVVRQMEPAQIANRLGCATLNNTQIVDFVEKPARPASAYAAIPFYIYPVRTLEQLRQYQQSGGNLDAPGSIIPWLIQHDGPVHAFITTENTFDVGTQADLKTLERTM